MVTAQTLKRGLNKGLSTTWELTKVVVTVYIFVTFLSYTPFFDWLARVCEPVMYNFEDTALFVLLGASWVILVVPRLTLAIVVTLIFSRWNGLSTSDNKLKMAKETGDYHA